VRRPAKRVVKQTKEQRKSKKIKKYRVKSKDCEEDVFEEFREE
jgi:hypothetical protein